MNDGRKNIDA
jgi:hypothetical protein